MPKKDASTSAPFLTLDTAESELSAIVALALAEDIDSGDLTASLIPADQQNQATIISRQDAVICGTQFVDAVYQQLDLNYGANNANNYSPTNHPLDQLDTPPAKTTIKWHIKDGDAVKPQQTLCTINGLTRSILSGERCALNFLQTLSSTATLTRTFVTATAGTKAQILDTRKTLPGLRRAQKYAVTCGGGKNHRFGLYDAILIKENHITAHGSITKVVHAAKNSRPDNQTTIEVEVTNLEELKEALTLPIDRIMLDNFDLENIRAAVKIADESSNNNHGHIKLEASGGVNLESVRTIAETGVDYISVGAITKTVITIEFSMLLGMATTQPLDKDAA